IASSSAWLAQVATVNEVTSGNSTARTVTAHAIPRWKRADSEEGQASTARLISRPSSEAVQVSFTGQLLHTCGRPRYRITRLPGSKEVGHSHWSSGHSHASWSS